MQIGSTGCGAISTDAHLLHGAGIGGSARALSLADAFALRDLFFTLSDAVIFDPKTPALRGLTTGEPLDPLGLDGSGLAPALKAVQTADGGIGPLSRDEVLALIAAAAQDILVVHVDADIRHLPEVRKHLGVSEAADELTPLCDHVKGWMKGGVPESVVIVLPREATDAWLCAAATHRADVEGIAKPADELRCAGVVGARGGAADKRAAEYEALAAGLAPILRDRRKLVRFVNRRRTKGRRALRSIGA